MIRRLLALALALSASAIVFGAAAGNTVPGTRLGQDLRGIGANDLKPTECASMNLTNVVTGTGTFSGTAGNDLILGGPGGDSIDGQGGDDCILAGGGDDSLDGGPGTDVCIGGPGSDTFVRTLLLIHTCETRVQ